MKMDIDTLVDLTISKVDTMNVYTEIPKEELVATLRKYFSGFYQKKLRSSNIKLNLKKIKGNDVSEQEYEEAIGDAQFKTICQAYAVAAMTYQDLVDLKEMNKL